MNEHGETSTGQKASGAAPGVSVIIPVYNEERTIGPVLDEVAGVLDGLALPHEILVVNDGSTDNTADVLGQAIRRHPSVRLLTLAPNSGQSAAFGAGFAACRGRAAVLMDGDGQNDPHDIPALLGALDHCDACCGYRRVRRDSAGKRLGSRIANRVRQSVLHDGILDTGCSLKAVKSEFIRDLPMYFRGMHRFLPVLWQMRGAKVSQVVVNHRPRAGGRSKYTNWGRLKETWWDLWAVRWMQARHRRFRVTTAGAES